MGRVLGGTLDNRELFRDSCHGTLKAQCGKCGCHGTVSAYERVSRHLTAGSQSASDIGKTLGQSEAKGRVSLEKNGFFAMTHMGPN